MILASLVASVRLKYSRVTTGPVTTISPTTPSGTCNASDQIGMASSRSSIILTCIPGTGRPTQTPIPESVAWRVSLNTSRLPIDATGRASVAP